MLFQVFRFEWWKASVSYVLPTADPVSHCPWKEELIFHWVILWAPFIIVRMSQTHFLILAAGLNELFTIKISTKLLTVDKKTVHSSVGGLKWRRLIIPLHSMLSITLFSHNVADLQVWFDCWLNIALGWLGFQGDVYRVLTSTGMVLICVYEAWSPLVCSQYSEKCVCVD